MTTPNDTEQSPIPGRFTIRETARYCSEIITCDRPRPALQCGPDAALGNHAAASRIYQPRGSAEHWQFGSGYRPKRRVQPGFALIRMLEEHGTEVQVIGPHIATIKTMGWNMLDRGNTASVMRAAFLGTSQQLSPDVIATLGGRRTLESV